MLHLTIQSLDGIQYDGPVKQITVPTLSGQITILPGHQPLVTICTTGLMKIVPPEIDDSLLGRYIITNKVINISISQGVLQIEGDQINIISAQATNSPTESLEILEQNKSDLLMKLEMIKVDQNSDAYEDILNDIQKIDADIKLSKLK